MRRRPVSSEEVRHLIPGKLLARLDDAELKPQVEVAQAAVVIAQATLDRLEADRVRAVVLGAAGFGIAYLTQPAKIAKKNCQGSRMKFMLSAVRLPANQQAAAEASLGQSGR